MVKYIVFCALSLFKICLCLNVFSSTASRSQLKNDILTLSREVERGVTETNDQRKQMEKLFTALEKMNPTKKPLGSELLVESVWNLEYTTSDSILGRNDFPRVGPILQKIDISTLTAENSETVSYFGINVPRKVTANLDPQTDSLTNVLFQKFTIGPISFQAPSYFRGSLNITYLDQNLRLSRGDKGNIFVLSRIGKN
jgi:hypothetical protein